MSISDAASFGSNAFQSLDASTKITVSGGFLQINGKNFNVIIDNTIITDRKRLENIARNLQNNVDFSSISFDKNKKITITFDAKRGTCTISYGRTSKKTVTISHKELFSTTLQLETPKKQSSFRTIASRIERLWVDAGILIQWPLFPLENFISNKLVVRSYFNYSWKAPILKKDRMLGFAQPKMAKHFSGQRQHTPIHRGYSFIKSFQKENKKCSSDEKKQIETLVKHRKILCDLSKKIETSTIASSRKEIQKRINSLEQTDSKDVVYVASNNQSYTSFTIPGGYKTHAITYEFQRDTKTGIYYFVIHNRGSGTSDSELHGRKIVDYRTNLRYCRTSVRIEVSKDAICDPEFLEKLLMAKHTAKSMNVAYTAIKEHLATGSPLQLKIEKSKNEEPLLELDKAITAKEQEIAMLKKHEQTPEQEKRLQKASQECFDMRAKENSFRRDLIDNDPNWHTIQSFGTCTESSLTGPEKRMASPQVRRKIKLYTIDSLAKRVALYFFLSNPFDIFIVFRHRKMRKERLITKIGNMAAPCA